MAPVVSFACRRERRGNTRGGFRVGCLSRGCGHRCSSAGLAGLSNNLHLQSHDFMDGFFDGLCASAVHETCDHSGDREQQDDLMSVDGSQLAVLGDEAPGDAADRRQSFDDVAPALTEEIGLATAAG